MRNLHYCMFIFSMFFLGAFASKGSPIENFIKSNSLNNDDTVLMFKVDLNGDEQNEFFLSTKNSINGKLGNIWSLYISTQNGYKVSDKLITLDYDLLIFKLIKRKFKMFSCISSDNNTLSLFEYTLSGLTLSEKKIATTTLSKENVDTFWELLTSKNISSPKFTTFKVYNYHE